MNPYDMPNGHALCPSCNGDVNLNEELYGFNTPVTRGSYEKIIYFLCRKCGSELNTNQSEDFAKKVIIDTIDEWLSEDKKQYAITTLTALIAHNFDPADAIEYGVPISKELNDKIVFGEINPYQIAPLLRQIAGYGTKENGMVQSPEKATTKC
jgi:hypothetical protein